jgi:hypothetical protein
MPFMPLTKKSAGAAQRAAIGCIALVGLKFLLVNDFHFFQYYVYITSNIIHTYGRKCALGDYFLVFH